MTKAQQWIRENSGRHFCQCGCNGVIPIKLHHHTRGVPRFINHHCARVENRMKGKFGKQNPNFNGGRKVTATGYTEVLIGNDSKTGRPIYQLEHRLVMETIIGRILTPVETVHHKNGIRTDNRPENLELWCRKHPAGQRVEDLVAWAKEILRQYGCD